MKGLWNRHSTTCTHDPTKSYSTMPAKNETCAVPSRKPGKKSPRHSETTTMFAEILCSRSTAVSVSRPSDLRLKNKYTPLQLSSPHPLVQPTAENSLITHNLAAAVKNSSAATINRATRLLLIRRDRTVCGVRCPPPPLYVASLSKKSRLSKSGL